MNATGMPETSQLAQLYSLHAAACGVSRDAFRAGTAERALHRRLLTVAEVADVAAFVVSDRAAGTTCHVLTGPMPEARGSGTRNTVERRGGDGPSVNRQVRVQVRLLTAYAVVRCRTDAPGDAHVR